MNQIITSISNVLSKNKTKIVHDAKHIPELPLINYLSQLGFEYLDDAKVHEPEFTQPKHITINEVSSKLKILETDGFFESPKTATEILQQLREYGWFANPLDVSKTLVKMAFNKEIVRNFSNDKTRYFQPITTYS